MLTTCAICWRSGLQEVVVRQSGPIREQARNCTFTSINDLF
jgi:hypothetical protein